MHAPLWEDALAAARVLQELALFAALALFFAAALLVDLVRHLWATWSRTRRGEGRFFPRRGGERPPP